MNKLDVTKDNQATFTYDIYQSSNAWQGVFNQ